MVYWTEKKLGEEVGKVVVYEHIINKDIDLKEECEKILKESEIVEEGCVDFVNNLEEVFDSIQPWCLDYRKKLVSGLELCKLIIKLLHVNILPLVKLRTCHKEALRQAMAKEEKFMNNLNDFILMKTIQLHEIKHSLKRNRNNLRQIFNSQSELKLQAGLPELLEYEFNFELEQNMFLFKELVSKFDEQTNVGNGREDLEMKIKETKAEILNLNKVLEKMGKVKKKKGWLRHFLSHIPFGEEAQLQKIYLTMHDKLKEIQQEIYTLMDKKLMVSSVIEAMRGVGNELKEGNDSYGVEIEKKTRVQMSNILSNSFATRSLLSLPEQISIILKDFSHPLTSLHFRMELEVRNLITSTFNRFQQQTLYNSLVPKVRNSTNKPCAIFFRSLSEINRPCSSENSLYEMQTLCETNLLLDHPNFHKTHTYKSSPNINASSTLPNLFGHKNCTNVATFCSYIEDRKTFFSTEYNFAYVTENIDQLKEEIPNHFASFCSEMQLEIDKTPNELNFRKVWVIYENYFFEHILDPLIKLYMVEYAKKVDVFVQKIGHLNMQDLDLTSSKVTRLFFLGSATKKFDSKLFEGHSPTTQASLSNIANHVGNFFNPTEELYKGPSEISSSSDFSDSFESDDESKLHQPLAQTSEGPAISPLQGCKDSRLDVKGTPLNSLSSSELLCMDVVEESDSLSVKLQPCILQRFKRAYEYLRQVLLAKTLMKKTHFLNNCLKEVSQQLERLSREVMAKPLSACNDDLMDAMVILLCNSSDHYLLSGLYIQVKLLADYLASFFEYGEFKFTLTQFIALCNHLQDKIFMKNYKESF